MHIVYNRETKQYECSHTIIIAICKDDMELEQVMLALRLAENGHVFATCHFSLPSPPKVNPFLLRINVQQRHMNANRCYGVRKSGVFVLGSIEFPPELMQDHSDAGTPKLVVPSEEATSIVSGIHLNSPRKRIVVKKHALQSSSRSKEGKAEKSIHGAKTKTPLQIGRSPLAVHQSARDIISIVLDSISLPCQVWETWAQESLSASPLIMEMFVSDGACIPTTDQSPPNIEESLFSSSESMKLAWTSEIDTDSLVQGNDDKGLAIQILTNLLIEPLQLPLSIYSFLFLRFLLLVLFTVVFRLNGAFSVNFSYSLRSKKIPAFITRIVVKDHNYG